MHEVKLIDTLKEKLSREVDSGKHAFYQSLPKALENILGRVDHQPDSRSEEARFKFMQSQFDFTGKRVLDIGCNLGYFSFSAVSAEAVNVVSYEGSKQHSEFMHDAIDLLGWHEKIAIHNKYYEFEDTPDNYDVGLLLNVLHHVGDDYGDPDLSIASAKLKIIEQLNGLASNCNSLIFQLGFNWRGDKKHPLFDNGTKKDIIEFISTNAADHWLIEAIGVASRDEAGNVIYNLLDDKNIERDDSLGEFLNRPIFILKSMVG